MTTDAGYVREVQPSKIPFAYLHMRKIMRPVAEWQGWDYVRETEVTTSNPGRTIGLRKRPMFGDQSGSLIGYMVFSRYVPGVYRCLVWWIKSYDRCVDPTGPYALSPEHIGDPNWRHRGPCEAVTPARVLAFFPEYRWC